MEEGLGCPADMLKYRTTVLQGQLDAAQTMCGRFSLSKPGAAPDRFGFVDFHETRPTPRFNLARSQLVLTVIEPLGRSRSGQLFRWGFT